MTHCGLPIEKAETRTSSPAAGEREPPQIRRHTHAGAEREPWIVALDQRQRARARVGANEDFGSGHHLCGVSAVPDHDCSQRPQAVARQLRRASIGVDEAHHGALRRESYRINPSPPAPWWRSHRRRATPARSTAPISPRRAKRKSLPYAWALIRCMDVAAQRVQIGNQVPAETLHPATREGVERADEGTR